jgi:ATP-dependent DNA ligase
MAAACGHFCDQFFLIDGEAVVCRPDGLSDFDALRFGRAALEVTLAAFDVIERFTG